MISSPTAGTTQPRQSIPPRRKEAANCSVELEARKQAGTLRWSGPGTVLFGRLGFAVLMAGLVAGIYRLSGSSSPWHSAAAWWPVYGTLIDAGCLALLWWFTRREGIRLFSLIGFDRARWRRDVALGAAFCVVAFPVAMGGIIGSSLLLFGKPQTSVYFPLPITGALYSVLIFPAIWGMTEEMFYNGYLLPRFQILSRSSVLAVAVVSFAWAFQHIALPLTFDPRYMLFRFMSFIPLALLATIAYLRLRRLLPFIVAHWALDALGLLQGVLIPVILAH